MDIASLSSQQVNTLYGIAAFLTFAVFTLFTLAVVGTLQRLRSRRPAAPPAAESPRTRTRVPADEVSVAA